MDYYHSDGRTDFAGHRDTRTYIKDVDMGAGSQTTFGLMNLIDIFDDEDEDEDDLINLRKKSKKSKKGKKAKKSKKGPKVNEVCLEMKKDMKKNPMYKKKGAFYQQAMEGYVQCTRMAAMVWEVFDMSNYQYLTFAF